MFLLKRLLNYEMKFINHYSPLFTVQLGRLASIFDRLWACLHPPSKSLRILISRLCRRLRGIAMSQRDIAIADRAPVTLKSNKFSINCFNPNLGKRG